MKRGYLLDTNVVSETRKPQPNREVITFLNTLPSSTMFASVLTLGELRKGVAKKRRSNVIAGEQLNRWIEEWERSYADRILPVDDAVARTWGDLHQTRTLPIVDSLLAATAITHRLTLVTRNTADIADLGVDLINPWLAS